MNNFLLADNAGAGAGSSLSFLFIIVIMFAVMYFTMIRPGKKQQTQRQTMLDSMKKGDAVVTIGGLHGLIDTINTADGTVVIDADGILLTFNRSAIREVKSSVGTTQTTADEEVVKPEATVKADEEAVNDDSESK